MATGSEDRSIRIWDIGTEREQRVLTGHTNTITTLAFSPDGRRLASSSEDGSVGMWDPATGASLFNVKLGAGFAEDVTFSPDGRYLIASAGAADESGNSVIAVYDSTSGERQQNITVEWNNANPIAATAEGKIFSSGGAGEDGEYVSTKIWDMKSGKELKSFHVRMNALSKNGKWGLSLTHNQGPRIGLWDLTTGEQVREITVPYFNVSRVAFSPNDIQIVAVADNGPGVKLYEAATGKEIRELPVAAGAVNFSWDGKFLATASGSSVEIWDLSNGNERHTLAGQLNARDAVFSSDGKMLITGGDSIGLWDIASARLIDILGGGTQTLALSPDGQWLATNPGGKLTVFSTRTWKVAAMAPTENAYVWSMGFASPGVSHGDLSHSGIRWWQVGTGPDAQSIWGATYATTFSPDGKLFATADARGGEVTVWSTATGEQTQKLLAHAVGINIVAFSPDGKWLLTAGQDSRIDPANMAASFSNMKHSIKLWEVGTWKNELVLPFTGMSGGFCGFSPDGQMLAISRADIGSIALYSMPDGRELRKLASSAAGRLAFSPDGLWEAQGLNLWVEHGEKK